MFASILLLAIIHLFIWPYGQRLEYVASDGLLKAHAMKRAPDPGILLINIDERSLERMAVEHGFGRWPWPRSTHAALLEAILKQQPRAVVFDILFSDWDPEHREADEYLVEVARDAQNTFFPLHVLPESPEQGLPLDRYGYKLGFQKTAAARPGAQLHLVPPLRPIAETGRIGAITLRNDPDGVTRSYYIDIRRDGWIIPSLPARVAEFLGTEVPTTEAITLNWNGPPQFRESYSYSDVFSDLVSGNGEDFAGMFTDTIVIIGGNAPSLADLRVTPIDNVHPGVDILATALGDLLNNDWLRMLDPAWVMLAVLALMLAIHWAFHFDRGLMLAAGVVLTGSLAWLAFAWFGLGMDLQVPVIPPIAFPFLLFLAYGLHQTLQERAARRQAISTFGRFIDPRVAESLVRDDSELLDAPPQSREVTVLFSDIRGFTTLSESRKPEEIVSLLNRYFAQQVDVIFKHGGTIDKFIGDAIMAFWGAPADDPDQADNAVAAAEEMVAVVKLFQQELAEIDIPFDIGIGLHTGPAVVGFIGSRNRLDYTVIGDTVNLASRIEGQTKNRARILISEDTRARCKHPRQYRDHGSVTVKGRAAPVTLYEPL